MEEEDESGHLEIWRAQTHCVMNSVVSASASEVRCSFVCVCVCGFMWDRSFCCVALQLPSLARASV